MFELLSSLPGPQEYVKQVPLGLLLLKVFHILLPTFGVQVVVGDQSGHSMLEGVPGTAEAARADDSARSVES